jgi:hypothetical protein
MIVCGVWVARLGRDVVTQARMKIVVAEIKLRVRVDLFIMLVPLIRFRSHIIP